MKKLSIALAACAVTALTLTPQAAKAGTLEDVKARGVLNCIVNTGLPGFSYTDASGRWKGFDADMCRSVAAAVLGDGEKVKYIPATGKTRFTLLNSKEGDVIFRNTTWTFVRDVSVKLNFIHTTYYDGQGFMIRKSKGVKSTKELDGATVCIQTGTTTELNLADYFRANKISYKPVPIESNEEARKNYIADRCDTYTTDASGLAATRASFTKPEDHLILPEIISKEPLGPVVRHGDDQWADIIRWTVHRCQCGRHGGKEDPRHGPPARRRRRTWQNARSRQGLGQTRHQGARQLCRDFRAQCRHENEYRLGARSQCPLHERRPAIQPAIPVKQGL